MKAKLKDLLRTALRNVGYDIVSYTPAFHSLARRSQFLRSLKVDLVLDVGANVGQYALQLREIGYCGPIASFEPVSEAFNALHQRAKTDPRWTVHNIALGEKSGSAVIHVSRNLQSSSLLPMLSSHLAAVPESAIARQEEIQVRRLDEIIDQVGSQATRIFLKMDTQGFEKAVMQGAAGCMNRVEAVQAEISLVPLYDGESDLCSFVSYMADAGFSMASIEPGFSDGSTGRMLQVDCVFAKRH